MSKHPFVNTVSLSLGKAANIIFKASRDLILAWIREDTS